MPERGTGEPVAVSVDDLVPANWHDRPLTLTLRDAPARVATAGNAACSGHTTHFVGPRAVAELGRITLVTGLPGVDAQYLRLRVTWPDVPRGDPTGLSGQRVRVAIVLEASAQPTGAGRSAVARSRAQGVEGPA